MTASVQQNSVTSRKENPMAPRSKAVIVTGGSQGIGAATVNLLLERGYSVIANSRHIIAQNELAASERLVLVEGDIALPATADKLIDAAITRFGSLDALVNSAGIFISKPFTDYTAADFRSLSTTNLDGFLFITQHAIKQMLAQGTGGSIVTITASIADHPLAALPASVAMITKGGINAISQSLALEFAKQHIRVNTVAPGFVDTPLLKGIDKDFLRSQSPMSVIASARDIAEAVLYLTEAQHVTGETLRVNGGSHVGKW